MAKKDDGKAKTKSTKKAAWDKIGKDCLNRVMSTVPTKEKFTSREGESSEVVFDVPDCLKGDKIKKPLTEYNKKKKEVYKEIMKPKEPERAIMGRPTLYTEELATYIVRKVATSEVGLKALCASDDKMPDHSTINEWRWDYPEFSSRYLVAKQMQAHLLAEDCEDIAMEKLYVEDALGQKRVDPGFTQSQRLRIDTKKWHASKLNPHYFGDKKLAEEMKAQSEEMKAEIQALRAELAEKNRKDY